MLPPIGALSSFVAAARYGSFSRAASETGLTQSGVSRQIALLEDWLQRPLFRRVGRSVELTKEGVAYLDAVAPALDRIRTATATALGRPDRELTVATLPSFGMRWLAPRLPELSARYPDLVVNFAARLWPFSFHEENFDAAIHFGAPNWPNGRHELLFREEAMVVCSPRELAKRPIRVPEDVKKWPLMAQATRASAWSDWFRVAGVSGQPAKPAATFEQFLMLAQAAVAGSGLALIPSFLIEPELASGALVSPLRIPLRGEGAYYMVTPTDRDEKKALREFRAWLTEEARSVAQTGD